MKKALLILLVCALFVCVANGCSNQLENTPTTTVQQNDATKPTQAIPTDVTSPTNPKDPDPSMSVLQIIHSFVEEFNEVAPADCCFENYEIRQIDDGYVVANPDGYSAIIRISPKGQVASFAIRNGTLQQKLNTAQTILGIFYPDNTIPEEKTDEINAIKSHVAEVKSEIQKQIQENQNAGVDNNFSSEFSDLSKQAEDLLAQIDQMRDQVEE